MNEALSAFAGAAGIAPESVSVLIRTLLMALTLIWAAWCVFGGLHAFKCEGLDISDLMSKFARIFVVVTVMTILVATVK